MPRSIMPRGGPAVHKNGVLAEPMHRYLATLEAVSGRVSTNVALSAGTTVAELKSDIAAIKAALIAAGLMESA